MRILCKLSNGSIAIAFFLLTLHQLRGCMFCVCLLMWLFCCFFDFSYLMFLQCDCRGFNKVHTFILTFKNYLRLLVSFDRITCRVVGTIHLWRLHGGARGSGSDGHTRTEGGVSSMWTSTRKIRPHWHNVFSSKEVGVFCRRISSLKEIKCGNLFLT